jgi:hypothetical protein
VERDEFTMKHRPVSQTTREIGTRAHGGLLWASDEQSRRANKSIGGRPKPAPPPESGHPDPLLPTLPKKCEILTVSLKLHQQRTRRPPC